MKGAFTMAYDLDYFEFNQYRIGWKHELRSFDNWITTYRNKSYIITKSAFMISFLAPPPKKKIK